MNNTPRRPHTTVLVVAGVTGTICLGCFQYYLVSHWQRWDRRINTRLLGNWELILGADGILQIKSVPRE